MLLRAPTGRVITLSQQFMSTFTHDFAVIGGGSGGLAAAKEAARAGAKVVLFDFVTPSVTRKTTWGFAGTCVNVGCIPKKLFHYSSLLGESMHDLKHLGFSGAFTEGHPTHNWAEMVSTVTNYIRKLNFSYRTGARSAGVEYINAQARFGSGDEHTVEYSVKGEKRSVRAKHVLVAVGSRPAFPPTLKGWEHAISSDDIFWSKSAPNKTLVVGGGYIAMECAGFLTGLGYETTVAVRSRPLRSFDSQIAEKVTQIMHEQGTEFLVGKTPAELIKSGEKEIQVLFDDGSRDVFNTVLIATGRNPETGPPLNLPASCKMDSTGKLVADPKTNLVVGTSSIYAVGDCLSGSPELTPVAIKDGEFLARRLFSNNSKLFFDKQFVPTTVFTPSEYGSVGLNEEEAVKKFGAEHIESFLYEWPSLERAALHREKPLKRRADEADVEIGNNCFTKLVVSKLDDRVVGFHFVGPNAGEITQGFALAVKLGAKKSDFDDLVGIHPTDAEALCALSITKSSGEDYVAAGGCGGGKCG